MKFREPIAWPAVLVTLLVALALGALALAVVSCSSSTAPREQSCVGSPLPMLFRPVLFDGSVGSSTLNHFVIPMRTADTVNVSWVPDAGTGGGALSIKVFGRCET